MAKNLKYSAALKNARLDQITAKLDAGAGAAKLQVYDGAQPASPDTAVSTQTKLAEFTCSDPFAAAAAGGILTANAIAAVNALAGGTAAWFRLVDSDGNAVIDGTVGVTAGQFDCIIDNTNIALNQQVTVNSLTINAGN